MTGERYKARAVVCARFSWMSPVHIPPAAAIATNVSATCVGIVPRMHEGQRSLCVRLLPSFFEFGRYRARGGLSAGRAGSGVQHVHTRPDTVRSILLTEHNDAAQHVDAATVPQGVHYCLRQQRME